MKQKIIIGLSVVLLLAAVYLIVSDLFRSSPASDEVSCCGDDLTKMKKIDTVMVGYTRVKCLDTGLKGLSGISIVPGGNIVVCGNRQLAIFSAGGEMLKQIRLDSALTCVVVTAERIYAGMESRVIVFDSEGNNRVSWTPYYNQSYITSIAASDSRVFVADARNKKVLQYTPEGALSQVIGEKDTLKGNPGFVIPSMYFDVAFGSFGELWVVNPGRLSLVSYNSKGNMQSSWGKASFSDDGFTGCCNPAHMAVLPDGSFATYEKGTDRIKVFNPAGQFITYIGGAGSFRGDADFHTGNLNLVKDMAVNAQGDVYILDLYNQINIFRKKR